MDQEGHVRQAFLHVEGLSKRFGGVRALHGANLAVARGEVHSLVGENGSGKSTLINILSGQVVADAGTITLGGEEIRMGRPGEALAAGIATVTQETTLVPYLSVAENILLGPRKVRGWAGINWQATRRRAAEILEPFLVDFSVDEQAVNLRPDQQQLVEIARAISMNARVLLLDEPTSSLTEDEVESLFKLIRSLKERGLTIIFVSHRMRELFAIVDTITVLRDGRTIESGPIERYDARGIIELMVGRASEEASKVRPTADRQQASILRVKDLSGPIHASGVSLSVGAGECVGLAGLTGSGRTELLETIFGLRRRSSGHVELGGSEFQPRRVTDAIASGVAYVPADRKNAGLVLSMSVAENVMMPVTSSAARLRTWSKSERPTVATLMHEFGIAASSAGAHVATLSGGNQQKTVLAKWFHTSPRLLLMDEPTRGVDVAAKREIHDLLAKAQADGVGILVSSSETEELLRLCDRILVMFRGEIVAGFDRSEANESRIAHYAMGAH